MTSGATGGLLGRLHVMASQGAASGTEAMDPTSGFLPIVRAMDSIPEPSRDGSRYVHLSALINPCVRMHALLSRSSETIYRPSVNMGPMRVVWRMGRAAEAHVREQYIKGVGRAGVRGSWGCQCGRFVREGVVAFSRRSRCSTCQGLATEYMEADLVDEEFRIVGHADMLLDESPTGIIPVEIKSMNKKQFDSLAAPLADHLYQAFGYRRILQRNGVRVGGSAKFVYVCKDYLFGSPYREFNVGITGQTERVLDAMWESARSIHQAKEAGRRLPERAGGCRSATCAMAANCPVSGPCYIRNE